MTTNKQYIQSLIDQKHRIETAGLLAVYVVMHPDRRNSFVKLLNADVGSTNNALITNIAGMMIIESKDVSTDEPLIVAK